MELFDTIAGMGHEQLVICNDSSAGYRGIIAIHSTTLGPALGGTRFWQYATDEEAIVDALRLARGMTYKNAVAGLNLGGGKSVIIGNNKTTDREMIFRAHGRFVESLGGRYITAEDVGTSTADMDFVHMETKNVAGLAGRSGDPSPVTAHGVFRAIQASAKERWGSDDLSTKTVSVQGAGHVGYYLMKELHEAGAKLIVTDIDAERVKQVVAEFGARSVAPDDIYAVQADIFAPCALGGIINDKTIPQLKVEIVAGAANNVLLEERHGVALEEKGNSLRARLRRERRRRDQRLLRARRLELRALVPQGRRDLRHDPQGLRDREEGQGPDLRRRRSARRAADQGGRQHGEDVAAVAEQDRG